MHTEAYHDHECGDCGAGITPDECPVVPMHDFDGNYYMSKICPSCGTVLMRITPGDDGLADDLRAEAELDPDAGSADTVL